VQIIGDDAVFGSHAELGSHFTVAPPEQTVVVSP
jgi:hypothetical protein